MRGSGEVTHRGKVEDDWLDRNGHMNHGYFPLAFVKGTAALFDRAGVGAGSPSDDAMYMLEMHLVHYRELLRRCEFYVETRLLGFDHNKMQFIHWMYDHKSGGLAASAECLALNVNAALRKASPFSHDVKAALWGLYETHSRLPPPPGGSAGRAIRQLGAPRRAF